MENDQRLTPLPVTTQDLQTSPIEVSLPYVGGYDETLDSKRSIRQYFNVVYKRLPLIIACTVVVTAAAALYSYRLPSEYSAATSIIINPRKPPQTAKDSININFGEDQKYYNTQLQLLQNQDLMKRVVISLGLQRDANLMADQNRGVIAGIKSLFGGSKKPQTTDDQLPVVGDQPTDAAQAQLTPEENARAEAYAATLLAGLKVEPIERTNIVNITVQNSNPALCAKVADKVAELFIKEDAERETSGAQTAYDDLKKSIEDLRATIAQQENDLIVEMKGENLPLQDKGADLRASDLQALLSSLRTAEDDVNKLDAQYRAAVAASRTGDILAIVPDNKAIQDARSQNLKRQADLQKRIEDIDNKINAANQDLQKLLVKYTPAYRGVQEKQAEIAELEKQKKNISDQVSQQIKSEGQTLEKNAEKEVLASLQAQLASAQQRQERQRALFDQASAQAASQGVAETRLTTVKDALSNNRNLLSTYTQRLKEQELAIASGRPNNISIQNRAFTPTDPIGPQRKRNILVAMLLSFAAGIGLAFLMDYLDDSVRSADDVSRHLGLPTLALIPHYLSGEKRGLVPAKSGAPAGMPPTALITIEDKRSPMAEAYRHLRTSLLFSSAGKPPQTILVTSSQPSEGKTTTAINTAITLAQSGAEVVIIDCDLRRPRLHNHFNLDNGAGLTNYLSGDKNTENLIKNFPGLPTLKVITSGPIPPNPAELLSSNEMRNLLTFLTGRFKHVVIDSPPAISFTDAAILSTLVDGVVLVAMANKSSIHLMRQFKQRLGNIGARIYGVVLNGLQADSQDYYYYYGADYHKYYNKAEDDDSTEVWED